MESLLVCLPNSLAHCYKAEFEALEEDELGIPLEQLITCIPGVQVVQKSPSSYKQVQWMENRSPVPEGEEKIYSFLYNGILIFD